MRDEVIEEIRERRKKMLREDYGGSIEKFHEEAQRWQEEHPDRVVNLRARKQAERRKQGLG